MTTQRMTPQPPGEDYTRTPTHVRVFREEWYEQDPNWAVDGADNDGNYTLLVFGRLTFAEAVAAVPEFVEAASQQGVRWAWDTSRPKRPMVGQAEVAPGQQPLRRDT